MKIALDKYYTPRLVARDSVQSTRDYVYSLGFSEDEIEWVECSAGAGVFLEWLPPDTLAYDLVPEAEGIIQQDFLTVDLPPIWMHPTKKIRVCIGNPPFGGKGDNILRRFFKHACQFCDIIAWVLPVNNLNNNSALFHFDLVQSQDLGHHEYSGVNLNCCFNVYQKPGSLSMNRQGQKRESLPFMSARIINRDSLVAERYKPLEFDLLFCSAGSVGAPVDTFSAYGSTMCILVDEGFEHREDLLDALYSADWKKEFPSISMPVLTPAKVIRYVKKRFPEWCHNL